MQEFFLKLRTIFHAIVVLEAGQDLPEYALTFVMVALGTVAGMSSIAAGVNETFSAVANTLITAVK
jgi:Flp pilus assembly pilin Flp